MDILTLIETYTEGQLRVLSSASALLHESPSGEEQAGKPQKRTVKRPPKPWKEMKQGNPADYLAYLEEAGL